MPPRRSSKKDSPAKLAKRMKRRLRVVLLRAKGEILGQVEAPDAQAAKTAAAVQFDLDEIQRTGSWCRSLPERRRRNEQRPGTARTWRWLRSTRCLAAVDLLLALMSGGAGAQQQQNMDSANYMLPNCKHMPAAACSASLSRAKSSMLLSSAWSPDDAAGCARLPRKSNLSAAVGAPLAGGVHLVRCKSP